MTVVALQGLLRLYGTAQGENFHPANVLQVVQRKRLAYFNTLKEKSEPKRKRRPERSSKRGMDQEKPGADPSDGDGWEMGCAAAEAAQR